MIPLPGVIATAFLTWLLLAAAHGNHNIANEEIPCATPTTCPVESP